MSGLLTKPAGFVAGQMEVEEFIERKGRRTDEAQLKEQVELTGIYLSYNHLTIEDDSNCCSVR